MQRLIDAAKAVVAYFEGEYWCIDVLSEAISEAEQQAADDALPITQDWAMLKYGGAVKSEADGEILIGLLSWADGSNMKIEIDEDGNCYLWSFFNRSYNGYLNLPHIKTRGQFRDLIKALKGGEA